MKKIFMLSTVVMISAMFFSSQIVTAAGPINLAGANNFAILANTYTNTAGGVVLNGDVGYTTPPAVAPTISGSTHVADAAYTQAGIDQGTALTALNTPPCDFTFGAATDLSLLSQPLLPGVYCVTGAQSIGSLITLNGAGTYIFRSIGALNTAANSHVVLENGADACNVFWAPTGATTLGATSNFVGTDIDNAGITIGGTVSWVGRALDFATIVSTGPAVHIIVPQCSTTSIPDFPFSFSLIIMFVAVAAVYMGVRQKMIPGFKSF